ncbi:MAG: molybdopterin-dependent oxidoreductase [Caldilineaceae bacterium]
MAASAEPAWVHRHVHEPNPAPPSADPAFTVKRPDGVEVAVDLTLLQTLPMTQVSDCWIVSTGHGKSGPFTFAGVHLGDLLAHLLPPDTVWQHVDVISADGFGARLFAAEVTDPTLTRPILLGVIINGAAMTRAQGLVRLIVPSETDDALRQVKWVGRIEIY